MTRLTTLAAGLALALGACRAAIPPWGSSIESAKRNVDNTFAAFAFRFFNVQRDAKFSIARPRMARFALIPSRIFNDTAVWTLMSGDSTRSLDLHGEMSDKGYLFSSRASAPLPARLGDERHVLRINALADGSYEWITRVEHGIGPVRAAQVATALGTLFTAFEGRDAAAIRADAGASFSRTSRHMRQVFAIDALHSTALPDGSTNFVMRVAITPDSARRAYPSYAAYLDKYIMPTKARLQLSDRAGSLFADVALGNRGFMDIRLRAKGGQLLALTGPIRPLPDSLRIRLDFSAKFMVFHVGYSNLVGDFTIERGAHERAWMLRFAREPEWDFPLAVDHLIRSSLRRPFAGRGSELRLAVRDDLGNQALSVREVRTAVKESAIMRWLGGLGSTAFGDFAGHSELEENRFLMELFGALRQDVAALTP